MFLSFQILNLYDPSYYLQTIRRTSILSIIKAFAINQYVSQNIVQPVLTTFVDIFKHTNMRSFSRNAWIICKTSIYSAICPVTCIHFLYQLSLILIYTLCQDGSVVSVSTFHAVGHGFESSMRHTKDHYKNASLLGT